MIYVLRLFIFVLTHPIASRIVTSFEYVIPNLTRNNSNNTIAHVVDLRCFQLPKYKVLRN